MTRGKQIIEEAKRIIAEAHEGSNNDPMVDLAIMSSFALGARWADKNPHWISVDEELPKDFKIVEDSFYAGKFEETDIVMVAFDDGDFGFAKYVHDFPNAGEGEAWYWFAEGNLSGVNLDDGEITHWMPLPQAPTCSEKPNNCEKGGEE